jgi:hypothetical protein
MIPIGFVKHFQIFCFQTGHPLFCANPGVGEHHSVKRRETTNMASSSARRSTRAKPKPNQGDAVRVGEETNSDGAVGSDDDQVEEKKKSEVSSDDEETEDEAAAKKNKKKKTTQKSGKTNPNKKKTENKKKRKKASEEEEEQEEDDDGVEEKKKSKKPAKKKHNSRYTWSRCIIFFSPNVCPPSSFLHLFSIFFPGTRGTKRGKGVVCAWPAVALLLTRRTHT